MVSAMKSLETALAMMDILVLVATSPSAMRNILVASTALALAQILASVNVLSILQATQRQVRSTSAGMVSTVRRPPSANTSAAVTAAVMLECVSATLAGPLVTVPSHIVLLDVSTEDVSVRLTSVSVFATRDGLVKLVH